MNGKQPEALYRDDIKRLLDIKMEKGLHSIADVVHELLEGVNND